MLSIHFQGMNTLVEEIECDLFWMMWIFNLALTNYPQRVGLPAKFNFEFHHTHEYSLELPSALLER